MRQFYFFLLLTISFQALAQDGRISVVGEIKNDSLTVENAHVINLNSEIGTISNKFGEFEISVKENDTLLFSNIQFENKMILIQKHHIENRYVKVNFKEEFNELDEVVIINSNNMSQSLGLPNADKIPMTQTERKVNYYKKAGSIDKIFGLISGDSKARKKIQKLEEADVEANEHRREILKIREHFKDDLFIYTLKIPSESINNFIASCLNQNIIPLFKSERYLDIIDIFLAKSKTFKDPNAPEN